MGARFGLEGWPEKAVHRDLEKSPKTQLRTEGVGGAVPPAGYREAPGSRLLFDSST